MCVKTHQSSWRVDTFHMKHDTLSLEKKVVYNFLRDGNFRNVVSGDELISTLRKIFFSATLPEDLQGAHCPPDSDDRRVPIPRWQSS